MDSAAEKRCIIGEERLMDFSLLKSDRFWAPSNGATAQMTDSKCEKSIKVIANFFFRDNELSHWLFLFWINSSCLLYSI